MTLNTDPSTIRRAALDRFDVAEENARFGREIDVSDLVASIPAVGDLTDALHCYEEDGRLKVYDGGRRLLALQSLAKGKKSRLPDNLDAKAGAGAGVPYLLDATKAQARERSLVTFVREKMHPADEFLAYKALVESGVTDLGAVAAKFAVPTARVRQLMRLTGVAPAILDLFRDGKLSLDMVEAFSLSEDHARQLAVWEGLKDRKSLRAYEIKSAFRSDAIDGDDRWAVFVGRDAYVEAGGTFLADLFEGREGQETWADRGICMILAEGKIRAMVEAVQAEGWANVEFKAYEGTPYDWDYKMDRLTDPEGTLDREKTLVFLKQDYQGRIERRFYLPKAKAVGAASANPAQADPAMYGYGHMGHNVMTYAATRATRVGIVRRPDVAYDALLTHLAWLQFGPIRGSSESSALTLGTPYSYNKAPPVDVEGDDEVDGWHVAWRARLDTEDRVEFCERIAAMTPEEKAQLLAVCVAVHLDAREEKLDYRKPGRWAHLGWIAERAGVDMAKAWRPDEEFMKRGSKPALLAALGEMDYFMPGDGPAAYQSMKKGELVGMTLNQANKTGWVPKLLATFTKVGDAAERKAAKKAARGAAVAKIAAKIGAAETPTEPAGANDAEDLSEAALALATGRSRPIADQDEADQD